MKKKLRPYQKRMFKIPNKEQFRTEEGRIILQTDDKGHKFIEAVLRVKEEEEKDRFVVCCPICRFYMERE